jgi:hypothetical protein
LSISKVKDIILTHLYDIAVLVFFIEKAVHGMILKTGPYETKNVKSNKPLRCGCRSLLSTLTRLGDPLNIVKSHRNPFETGVRKYYGPLLSICSQNSFISSLQVLKTFAGKHLAPFRKSENLAVSQLRLVFAKFVCIPIKKASPARGDFLRISLNYHAPQNPNHQLREKVTTVAPEGTILAAGRPSHICGKVGVICRKLLSSSLKMRWMDEICAKARGHGRKFRSLRKSFCGFQQIEGGAFILFKSVK